MATTELKMWSLSKLVPPDSFIQLTSLGLEPYMPEIRDLYGDDVTVDIEYNLTDFSIR